MYSIKPTNQQIKPNSLSRYIFTVSIALFFIGCGKSVSPEHISNPDKFGQRFAELIYNKDYVAAYSMTDTYFQKHFSIESFKAIHENNIKKFGPTVRFRSESRMIGQNPGPDDVAMSVPNDFPFKIVKEAYILTFSQADKGCYECEIYIFEKADRLYIGYQQCFGCGEW